MLPLLFLDVRQKPFNLFDDRQLIKRRPAQPGTCLEKFSKPDASCDQLACSCWRGRRCRRRRYPNAALISISPKNNEKQEATDCGTSASGTHDPHTHFLHWVADLLFNAVSLASNPIGACDDHPEGKDPLPEPVSPNEDPREF